MHFSLLHISNTNSFSEISSNMTPFQRYDEEEDFPEKYLEFQDETSYIMNEWENKKIVVWRGPNNQIIPHNIKSDLFYRKATEEEQKALENNDDIRTKELKINGWKHSKGVYSIYQEPKDYKQEEILLKEYMPNFEDYADYYTGGKDPKTGRYGNWQNPNATHDFWSIGGRFSGLIKTKELTNVNQIQKKDFDIQLNIPIILPVSAILNQKKWINLDESDLFTTQENWDQEIKKFLDQIPDEKWLTIIDCHI